MSQIVEIPGQGEVEFPDSMGDADIAAAAKKLSAPPPGSLGSRFLSALTTPFKAMQPVIDANKAQAEPAAFPVTKDSSDTRVALQSVLSGVPGYQARDTTDEENQREARFRKEHGTAAFLLPMLGGLGKPAALPATVASGAAQEAGPAARALLGGARNAGRRVLYGGANGLSERFPVPDASIDAAAGLGAFKVGGTTEHAANVISDALDEAGALKGDVVKQMEAAGIRGPDASNVAQVLRSKANWLRKNSAGTNLPELYEKVAGDIEAASGDGGRLGVAQAERIKTSLQKQAKYGRPEETLANIERRKIASTLRGGIEDASAADAATIGTPQLEDIRSKIESIRGGPAATEPTPGIGPNIDVVTPEARAAQDARAAALSRAAQEANAQLIPAKNAYALLAPAAKAAEKGLSQATKRNAFSLRDTTLAAGHGAAGTLTTLLLSKAARTFGPSTAASLLYKGAAVSPRVQQMAEALMLRGIPQDAAREYAVNLAGGD